MNCKHCNGECCYLDKREGTTRYAQMLPHGKGVHYCKYCDDGTEKEVLVNFISEMIEGPNDRT